MKFFASLREAVGHAELTVQADNLAGVVDALSGMLSESGLAEIRAENVRISLNQTLVEGQASFANVALSEGDEIAFLPPVTGG